ncbi:MAG: HEAT repeat domain-containing protein [Elusimicrobiaceae bacterium]|nr:HEAT repeat domain-containing protein [Elusimicrobiaceae bacterium]
MNRFIIATVIILFNTSVFAGETTSLSPDREKAEAAVSALCESKSRNAASELERALGNTHWEVRKKAVTCLGNLKNRDSLPPILAMTKDENPAVESAAFDSIVAFASPEAAEILRREVYSGAEYGYRKKAAVAIGRMDNPAITAMFIEDAKSTDTIMADRAAMVLVNMQTGAAVRPLAQAAQTGVGFVRQAAKDALTTVSDPAAEPELARLLNSADYDTELRLIAAKSLAIIRSSSSIAALDAFASDSAQPAELRKQVRALCNTASMHIMRYLTALMFAIVAGGIWWMYRKGADL